MIDDVTLSVETTNAGSTRTGASLINASQILATFRIDKTLGSAVRRISDIFWQA